MDTVIASVIPHAVAVALSPMPIAALILLLLSNKARSNSVAFLLGWMVALLINVGICIILFSEASNQTQSKSMLSSLISALLGITLLFLAFKQWRGRPKTGETPITPKWMQTLESFTPLKAFGVAFLLVTLNAKNTVLDIATGVIIGQKATSVSEGITALLIFTVIASSTIIIPVSAFLLYGNRLTHTLDSLKQWFMYNSATILFVLFLILGVSLLSKAFGG